MIVVADTSPLNYLIRSGYVWILPELFGRVIVPKAVLAEMQHPRAPEEVQAFSNSPPPWLECVEAGRIATGLDPSLGEGEREAISLALDTHADALLLDDLAGRREAQSRQIAARGTVAVLLQAFFAWSSLLSNCFRPASAVGISGLPRASGRAV